MAKVPELVSDWSELAAHTIEKNTEIKDQDANELAMKIIMDIVRDFGGMQFYIPVCFATKIDQRNDNLLSEFDGTNRDELCRRYAISRQTFYTAIRRAREVRRASATGPLTPKTD